MTKLDKIRKGNNIIEVTKTLFIHIDKKQINLSASDDINNDKYFCGITDKEIKPLIKALQELIA